MSTAWAQDYDFYIIKQPCYLQYKVRSTKIDNESPASSQAHEPCIGNENEEVRWNHSSGLGWTAAAGAGHTGTGWTSPENIYSRLGETDALPKNKEIQITNYSPVHKISIYKTTQNSSEQRYYLLKSTDIHGCIYQSEDLCIRRKRLEGSTRLQIYWIPQVECWNCRCNEVWSLCQHSGNTCRYEAVGTVEARFNLPWIPEGKEKEYVTKLYSSSTQQWFSTLYSVVLNSQYHVASALPVYAAGNHRIRMLYLSLRKLCNWNRLSASWRMQSYFVSSIYHNVAFEYWILIICGIPLTPLVSSSVLKKSWSLPDRLLGGCKVAPELVPHWVPHILKSPLKWI